MRRFFNRLSNRNGKVIERYRMRSKDLILLSALTIMRNRPLTPIDVTNWRKRLVGIWTLRPDSLNITTLGIEGV